MDKILEQVTGKRGREPEIEPSDDEDITREQVSQIPDELEEPPSKSQKTMSEGETKQVASEIAQSFITQPASSNATIASIQSDDSLSTLNTLATDFFEPKKTPNQVLDWLKETFYVDVEMEDVTNLQNDIYLFLSDALKTTTENAQKVQDKFSKLFSKERKIEVLQSEFNQLATAAGEENEQAKLDKKEQIKSAFIELLQNFKTKYNELNPDNIVDASIKEKLLDIIKTLSTNNMIEGVVLSNDPSLQSKIETLITYLSSEPRNATEIDSQIQQILAAMPATASGGKSKRKTKRNKKRSLRRSKRTKRSKHTKKR